MNASRTVPSDHSLSDAHQKPVAGDSINEHLAGLSPQLVALIRKAAAAHVATAPAPSVEQIKALAAIFQVRDTTVSRGAA